MLSLILAQPRGLALLDMIHLRCSHPRTFRQIVGACLKATRQGETVTWGRTSGPLDAAGFRALLREALNDAISERGGPLPTWRKLETTYQRRLAHEAGLLRYRAETGQPLPAWAIQTPGAAVPPAAGGRMRRLMIIACGDTKRPDPGLMPAIDRYNGPPYCTLRANLRELAEDRRPTIIILSAEFGLIPAETPIPDYDHRMQQTRALALRSQVRAALAAILADGDVAATFVNLGADYTPALPLDPDLLPHLGALTTAQGGIGERMAQLKRWLREA